MSIYTISPCFLSGVDEDLNYLSNILFVFTNKTNVLKVSQDKHGEILKIYKTIPQNGEVIKTWLDLMSFSPSSFEKIDIDLTQIECSETKFVKLCKETKGFNNLIIYSLQNIKQYPLKGKKINFEDIEINLLDRDDAVAELNEKISNIYNIKKSQVALNGSSITDSENS